MNRGMIKTHAEIVIARGGALLSCVLGKIVKHVAPGVTTAELDEPWPEKEILKAGDKPVFKGYRVYGVKQAYNSTGLHFG